MDCVGALFPCCQQWNSLGCGHLGNGPQSVMGQVGSPWQLQAQPLDVLAAEVYAQSQHLAYFSRSEAPRQWARVRAPVI